MKKSLLLGLFLLMGLSQVALAQYHAPACFVCPRKTLCDKYYETFDSSAVKLGADSNVTITGSPTLNKWERYSDATLATQGTTMYRGYIAGGGNTYFATQAFCTKGNFKVYLSFKHIAHVSPFDSGFVYIRKNNGPWTLLRIKNGNTPDPTGNATYFRDGDDNMNYLTGSNMSNAASYPSGTNRWNAANPGVIPTLAFWRTEKFDISDLAADGDSVFVRFELHADPSATMQRFGWVLDSIRVQESISEIVNPVITHTSITGYQFNIDQDITALIADESPVLGRVRYRINGGTWDSIPMTRTTGNTFVGRLNRPLLADGDTVEYYIYAEDSSLSRNDTTFGTAASPFKYWVSFNPIVSYPNCGATCIGKLNYPLGPDYQGTIYQVGNICIRATVDDASGIKFARLYYKKNSGSFIMVPMTYALTGTLGYDILEGCIPGVVDNDTICYYIHAMDSSGRFAGSGYETINPTQVPIGNCRQFVAKQGILFPWCEAFDTANHWTTTKSNSTHAGWQRGRVQKSVITGPALSAPNGWVTDTTANYPNNANWTLESDVFSFLGVNDAKLSFWQWRNVDAGATPNNPTGVGDCFYLEWSDNWNTPNPTWQVLDNTGAGNSSNWYNKNSFVLSNNRGWDGNSNGWVKSWVIMSQLNNRQGVKIRFVFKSNASGVANGVALDNICIEPPVANNAGVLQLIAPPAEVRANNTTAVNVVVKNYGFNAIASLPIGYNYNGTVVHDTLTFSPPLAPNATSVVRSVLPFTSPTYMYKFCVYTELSGDFYNNDDTVCSTVFGVPTFTVPFSDNFDTIPPIKWSTRTNNANANQWAVGTPAKNGFNSGAYSAPNAWVTSLNNNYGLNSDYVLVSPYFDFSQAYNTKLSFYSKRALGANAAFRVQYTLDSVTWVTLGTNGMTNIDAKNWYNGTVSGTAGFVNTDTTWKYSEIRLPSNFNFLSQKVRFRVQFVSGNAASGGVAIDNFQISLPPPVDVAVLNYNTNQPVPAPTALPTNVTIGVRIRNYGRDTLTAASFNFYRRNLVTPFLGSSVTIPVTLAPAADTIISFPAYTCSDPYFGTYTLRLFSTVAGDADRSQDTISMQVREVYAREIQLIRMSRPNISLCSPAIAQPISFLVKNNGHLNMDTITVSWNFNNGATAGSYTFNSVGLPYNQTTKLLVPGQTFAPNLGPNTGRTNINCLHDKNLNNDSLNFTLTGIPLKGLDYCNSFDSTLTINDLCLEYNGAKTIRSITGDIALQDSSFLTVTSPSTGGWIVGTAATIWDDILNLNSDYTMRQTIPFYASVGDVNVQLDFDVRFVAGTEAWIRIVVNDSMVFSSSNTGGNRHIAVPLAGIYTPNGPIVVTIETKVSPSGGVAIDNFCLVNKIPNSVGLINLRTMPKLVFKGNTADLDVTIKNSGINPITGFTLNGKFNGTAFNAINVTGLSLAPGQTQAYTLAATTFNWTLGANTVELYTSQPNGQIDYYATDDTLRTSVVVLDTIQSLLASGFCDDFEGGKAPWMNVAGNTLTYHNDSTDWVIGNPAKTVINGAYQGTKSWYTGTKRLYTKNRNSVLVSPRFEIIPNKCYELSFQNNYLIDTLGDGATVEFSIDNGANWATFGGNEPNWFNQYNIPALWDFSPGSMLTGAGWNGYSNGWVKEKKTFKLDSTLFPNPSYNVVFRLRFASDFSMENEGVAVDSFCILYAGNSCFPLAVKNIKVGGLKFNPVYPNPTSYSSIIPYEIPTTGNVTIMVSDIAGKVVKNVNMGTQPAGAYTYELNTADMNSGTYFVTLIYKNNRNTQKLIVVKQ